jgi:hypothetical protein
VATSRRNPCTEPGTPAPPPAAGEGDTGGTGTAAGAAGGRPAGGSPGPGTGSRGAPPKLPPVRLAPREELAAAARVAPLLRAARLVACWAAAGQRPGTGKGLAAAAASAAIAELELTPAELDVAWRAAAGTGMVVVPGQRAAPGPRVDVLASGDAGDVLTVWEDALRVMLGADDLDGMATALYTVGGPVKMDALFEAYMAAAGSRDRPGRPRSGGEDLAAGLSSALETLADLGVVELGTDDTAGGLTVTLSRLGVWGMHRHLGAQGWHVPVLGSAARDGAAALLTTLASCDAEDGEAEIAAWLAARAPAQAAGELIDAARRGTPGLRGAGFAVLDRIGEQAVPAVRAALDDPVLRAHAAVWLHEHGEEAELGPGERAWLLVDLGAGLLEEADPRDVVVELLPDLPPKAQADMVAGLWEVDHPAVTDLLTALSEHHPDPAVARAARKAAFKARSPSPGPRRTSS